MVPARTVSPMAFSTGVASPVRLDSSLAVWPLTISASTGNWAPGLTSRRMPGRSFSTCTSRSWPCFVEHGGGLGRVAEQRTDLPLGAAQREMLQRAGEREQEQQRRAFAPGADAGAAERRRPA